MKKAIHRIRTLNHVISSACIILIILFGIYKNVYQVVVWSYGILILVNIANILILMLAKKRKLVTGKNGEIIGLVIIVVIFLFGLLRYLVLNGGAS